MTDLLPRESGRTYAYEDGYAYEAVPAEAAEQSWRIDDLVWNRAAADSTAPAVIDGDRTLSYGQLVERAADVAAALVAAGVNEGDAVAALLDRSAEFLIGVLGILRAGAVCLPLAPSDPPTRWTALADAVGLRAIVTDRRHTAAPAARIGLPIVFPDGDNARTVGAWRRHRGSGDATAGAFYIGTSGSTGVPKAVRITHANYTAQLGWITRNLGLSAADRCLFKAPVSFVSMLRQVVWPLAAGACLVVVPPGAEADVPGQCRLIDEHRISFMTFISPALAGFLRHCRLDGGTVRNVVSGGDRFPAGTAREFFRVFPQARLHHTYGMSEAILISCAPLTGPEADERGMGPVLPGSTAHVLDEKLAPTAVGEVGELHVGGVGLTPGYAGGAQVGADRFIVGPGSRGERLFATRDLARPRADGTFELVGRSDSMVKVRGYRVELSEIERTLGDHPAVRQCVSRADAAADGDTRITAYLVAAAGTPAQPADAELRGFLRERLPAYMAPNRFLWLDALPLTNNGKIDRAALPQVPWAGNPQARSDAHADVDAGTTDCAPEDLSPHAVADIVLSCWRAALADGDPAVESDFFTAGGTSLAAIDLAARIGARLGREMPVTLAVDFPSLAGLTAAVLEQTTAR